MTRQPPCGAADGARRGRMARLYLEMADLAATRDGDEARNVAAGNAVLAAVAAADALCCLRLGRYSRGQAHHEAAALLRTIKPNGVLLARDLTAVLAVKDPAHYGTVFLAAATVKSALRAASRLVEAAEDTLAGAS